MCVTKKAISTLQSGLTVGSCWTSSAAELPLDMLAVEAPLFAVVDVVAGASAPNPESKLGFLAAALPLQLFIPLAEDDAAEVGIFPSLLSLLNHLIWEQESRKSLRLAYEISYYRFCSIS